MEKEEIIKLINDLPIGAWHTEEEAEKQQELFRSTYVVLVRKRLFLEKLLAD